MAMPWSYVTIMKGREAEYGALALLDQKTSDEVTPMIQLWPGQSSNGGETEQMWPDNGGDKVARDLITNLLARIKDRWPEDRPVLLDGEWLANGAAYTQVLDAVRGAGRRPLPVTGLERPDDYQQVVAQAVAQDGQGCVLRLGRDDFTDGFAGRLDARVAKLGLTPDQIDIVLDLREIEQRYLVRDEILVTNVIRSLPHLEDWRNLALAGSSAPARVKVDDYPLDSITPYPRLEWWLWQMVRKRGEAIGRLLIYGDYGASHPDRVEESSSPGSLPRIPQIRYTGENETLLLRGQDLKKDETDPDQFRRLLGKLIADKARWSGDDYSWAERWIIEVARGGANLSIAMIWHRVWTVHHWTFVIQQLASRSDF